MEYEYILFDLDGTITDSVIGITNSVRILLLIQLQILEKFCSCNEHTLYHKKFQFKVD